MYKFKKFSSFLVALSLLLSSVHFSFQPVLASDKAVIAKSEHVDGDLSPEEGAKPYKPSKKDIEMLEKKSLELKSLESKSGKNSLASINQIYNVPVFRQINGYYCGPATVKQVLHYLNGWSLSQEEYGAMLGTTSAGTNMTDIPRVLNANQSKAYYMYQEINNFTDWYVRVDFDITRGNPVIIDIKATQADKWKYTTNGHFLCISGYSDATETKLVWLTDPHPTYYGTYMMTAEDTFKVNMNHWRKAIIW